MLAFGPEEDARAVAAFPESIYKFYSVDESRALLSMAGFLNVTMSSERIASRQIVLPLGIAEPTARSDAHLSQLSKGIRHRLRFRTEVEKESDGCA